MRHMARAPEDMTSELHARLSKILSTSDTARRVADTDALFQTIEGLRGDGRTLKPCEIPEFTEAERKLAESQLLDPESADNGFEPQSRPGLLTRLGHRGSGYSRTDAPDAPAKAGAQGG